MVSEEEFICSIDCCFDYDHYKPLVDKAKSIAPACVEMVVYEIIHPPRSANVSFEAKMEMLEYIGGGIAETGRKILNKCPVTADEKKRYRSLFLDS